MALPGPQFRKLQEALIAGFPSVSVLRRMVRFELDANIDQIASSRNLDDIVYELIQWAEANGRVEELVHGAYRDNSGNEKIINIASEFGLSSLNSQADAKAPRDYSVQDTSVPLDTNSNSLSLAEESIYLDFNISIKASEEQQCRITASSVLGNRQVENSFPLTNKELEFNLERLEHAITRSATKRRSGLTKDEKIVQEFGKLLFDFLLSSEIGDLFRQCQTQAGQLDKGVRIRLNIQLPTLSAIPWEYIFDPQRTDYVCLDPNTPLIRYLDISDSYKPLPISPPLRILGMAASPNDLSPLDVEKEKSRIEDALKPLQSKNLVELHWLGGQSWRDLQRAMRSTAEPWHVFHFIGHGSYSSVSNQGLVYFVGANGQAKAVRAIQLKRLFGRHSNSLRLVILNMCAGASWHSDDIFSNTAASLVQSGIPAVLAMQFDISDTASIEFSRTLYESLTSGMPIEIAVSEARNAVTLKNAFSLEWGVPVLYTRSSVGNIFQIEATSDLTNYENTEPEHKPENAKSEIATDKDSADLVSRNQIDEEDSYIVDDGDTSVEIASDTIVQPIDGSELPTSIGTYEDVFDETKSEKTKHDHVALEKYIDSVDEAETNKDSSHIVEGKDSSEPKATSNVVVSNQDTSREFRADKRGKIDFEWATIPAGEYVIGSDPAVDFEAFQDEFPQHQLRVESFKISRTQVTNSQYRLFIDGTGYAAPSHWKNGLIPQGKENHPVVFVSLLDALQFCTWANVRLPSEFEWEIAARGDEARKFPWGNRPPTNKLCNFNSEKRDTTPVNYYRLNRSLFGCLDMAGNVWEWTNSQFRKYPYDVTGIVVNPKKNDKYILKGGSMTSSRRNIRAARRYYLNASSHSYDIGFRVVRA